LTVADAVPTRKSDINRSRPSQLPDFRFVNAPALIAQVHAKLELSDLVGADAPADEVGLVRTLGTKGVIEKGALVDDYRRDRLDIEKPCMNRCAAGEAVEIEFPG
jgi:hypothetical protein